MVTCIYQFFTFRLLLTLVAVSSFLILALFLLGIIAKYYRDCIVLLCIRLTVSKSNGSCCGGAFEGEKTSVVACCYGRCSYAVFR